MQLPHRLKEDGTADHICLACMATIPKEPEEDPFSHKEEHICVFAFPGRRAGTLPKGVEQGRRRSDVQWKSFARET